MQRASERNNPGTDFSNMLEDQETDINNVWPGIIDQVGELAVDVIELADKYRVISTVAGVNVSSLEISMTNDMLTIRGSRVKREIDNTNIVNYLHQECFWGKFSRSIILPKDIVIKKIKASMEEGVLTVELPFDKVKKETIIKIKEK